MKHETSENMSKKNEIEENTLDSYYNKQTKKESAKIAKEFINNIPDLKSNASKQERSFFDIAGKKNLNIPRTKFKIPYLRLHIKKITASFKRLYDSTIGIRKLFIRIFNAIKRKGNHERSILIFYKDEESGVRLPINNFTLVFLFLVLGALVFTGMDAYSKQQEGKAFYNTLSTREASVYSLVEDYRNTLERFSVALNSYNGALKNMSTSINYDSKNNEDILINKDKKNELTNIYKTLNELETYQKNVMSFLDISGKVHESIPVGWPVAGGGRITSGFGGRPSPFTKQKSYHYGVDIAGAYGMPILAVSDGVVNFAGWRNGYGWFVIISHANGYQTAYGHNSKLLVKSGQRVKRGEKIALIGNTGRTTGIHCHFEVRIDGDHKNPMPYLSARF